MAPLAIAAAVPTRPAMQNGQLSGKD